MKRPSFRLRIALLSTALAGSALVGFGIVCWFQIYNAQISRLDARIFNQLVRANRPPERDRLQRYKNSVIDIFSGTNTKIPVALLVFDANGNTLHQSNEVPGDLEVNRLLVQRLQLTPAPPQLPKSEPPPQNPSVESSTLRRSRRPPQFVTLTTATGAWRIGSAKFPNVQVAIAVNLQAVNQEMATINNIFLVSIPGALLLVASGAWLVSGSVLRPIRQLTGVIQQVTVKGLDQRIPIGTTDVEFVELIQVFNQMLERLERSFTQASRFSADAAHELKTRIRDPIL